MTLTLIFVNIVVYGFESISVNIAHKDLCFNEISKDEDNVDPDPLSYQTLCEPIEMPEMKSFLRWTRDSVVRPCQKCVEQNQQRTSTKLR